MNQNRKPSGNDSELQQQSIAASSPTAPPAERVGGGRGTAKEDAPSSNTASSSCRNEENIKIILKGIDSLYFSVPGALDPQINQDLADRKLFAQSKKAEHQAKAV